MQTCIHIVRHSRVMRHAVGMCFIVLGFTQLLLGQVIPGVPPADTASLKPNRLSVLVNGRNSLATWIVSDWPGSITWAEGPVLRASSVVYDHGLSVLGRIDGRTHAAVVLWGSGYGRGPIINGRPAMDERAQDSMRYRPYTLFRGDTSAGDHAIWPIDLGAPVDSVGKPLALGDAMIWTVANGLDSLPRVSGYSFHPHLRIPIEVQHTVYGRSGTLCDSVATLANTLFFEWTIVAKGSRIIDSVYAMFWTDIDIGEAMHDIPAVDSAGQFAYCVDMSGDAGAAVGYCLLAGPVVGQSGSSALVKGKMRDGYRPIGLTAFKAIGDDSNPETMLASPPKTVDAMWNTARGFDNLGRPIIHPQKGTPTHFPYDGSPATGSGWILDRGIGGGAGFILSSGPFRLAPGDTQWVLIALTVARGVNREHSVEMLGRRFAELRSMPYDSIQRGVFTHVPCNGTGAELPSPLGFALSGPFPHPVRSEALLRFELASAGQVSIDVIDVLGRHCLDLLHEGRSGGVHELRFRAAALTPGLYLCRIRCGSDMRVRPFLVAR